jgi:hypothetical protein
MEVSDARLTSYPNNVKKLESPKIVPALDWRRCVPSIQNKRGVPKYAPLFRADTGVRPDNLEPGEAPRRPYPCLIASMTALNVGLGRIATAVFSESGW